MKNQHLYNLTETVHFKETQMTETQIGGIIELTSKDPNFESLFNLFQGKSLTDILCTVIPVMMHISSVKLSCFNSRSTLNLFQGKIFFLQEFYVMLVMLHNSSVKLSCFNSRSTLIQT